MEVGESVNKVIEIPDQQLKLIHEKSLLLPFFFLFFPFVPNSIFMAAFQLLKTLMINSIMPAVEKFYKKNFEPECLVLHCSIKCNSVIGLTNRISCSFKALHRSPLQRHFRS